MIPLKKTSFQKHLTEYGAYFYETHEEESDIHSVKLCDHYIAFPKDKVAIPYTDITDAIADAYPVTDDSLAGTLLLQLCDNSFMEFIISEPQKIGWRIPRMDYTAMEEAFIIRRKIGKKRDPTFIIKDFLRFAIIILCIWLFPVSFVPTGSMEETIPENTLVCRMPLYYDIFDVNRYDCISFYAPDKPGVIYTKRVIGLPRDQIIVENGKVFINGEEITEPYIKETMHTSKRQIFNVPEGKYFVMGDNRNASIDSRYWDMPYIQKDSIESRVMYIYNPLKQTKDLYWREE